MKSKWIVKINLVEGTYYVINVCDYSRPKNNFGKEYGTMTGEWIVLKDSVNGKYCVILIVSYPVVNVPPHYDMLLVSEHDTRKEAEAKQKLMGKYNYGAWIWGVKNVDGEMIRTGIVTTQERMYKFKNKFHDSLPSTLYLNEGAHTHRIYDDGRGIKYIKANGASCQLDVNEKSVFDFGAVPMVYTEGAGWKMATDIMEVDKSPPFDTVVFKK